MCGLQRGDAQQSNREVRVRAGWDADRSVRQATTDPVAIRGIDHTFWKDLFARKTKDFLCKLIEGQNFWLSCGR